MLSISILSDLLGPVKKAVNFLTIGSHKRTIKSEQNLVELFTKICLEFEKIYFIHFRSEISSASLNSATSEESTPGSDDSSKTLKNEEK